MSSLLQLWKSLAVALTVVFLLGCASSTARMSDAMDGLIGTADKTYFANKYGPPDKQATLDADTELWEYRLNEQNYTSPTGYRFSTFDRLRLTFRNGKLHTWNLKSEVQ